MTTTLTSRGQIVIPKPIRDTKRWKPGDDFEVIAGGSENEIILRKLQSQPNEGLSEALDGLRGLKIPPRRKVYGRRPPRL